MTKKRSISFIIAKVLVLQTFFYFTTRLGPEGYGMHFFLGGLAIMFINFYFIRDLINFKPYLLMMALFFFAGFIEDTIFIHVGIIKMDATFPPIWFPTLWLMFLGYYGDVFNKMMDFPIWLMAILGAIGGSLAYYRGFSVLGIPVIEHFYWIIAFIWALFMPFSLKLFKYYKLQKIGNL